MHAAKASDEVVRDFMRAMDQSRFLYRPAVRENLEALWRDYCNFGAVKSMMKGGPERPDWHQLVESENRALLAFDERLKTLSAVFGDELVIATPAAPADAARV